MGWGGEEGGAKKSEATGAEGRASGRVVHLICQLTISPFARIDSHFRRSKAGGKKRKNSNDVSLGSGERSEP